MNDTDKGILVVVESAGIQTYIFRSNRLRENVGASYLVDRATDRWAKEAVVAVADSHNISMNGDILPDEQGKDAEILYAGGGNCVVWFSTPELARQFTRELTAHVLRKAPGLQITVAHRDFKAGEPLSKAILEVLRALKPARSSTPRFSPLAGLGVTAACQSTGMPAVAYREVAQDESRYVSAEVNAKLNNFQAADKWLEKMLALGAAYTYPQDIDKLGREEGESSYIAVVHADGNGMGNLIRQIGDAFPTMDLDGEYLRTLRTFSEGIKTMTQNAMQHLLDLLMTAVHRNPELDADVIEASDQDRRIILNHDTSGNIILPFRPLVTGGDDVTFLCDGRIGLSLAIAFLRFFEEESRSVMADLKQKLPDIAVVPDTLTACAGIAIVKSHYPFARAYELAEDLCASAKKFRLQKGLYGCALDWHFTPGGLYGNIEDMRKREYRIGTENEVWNLTVRPVSLDNEQPIQNWPLINAVLDEFMSVWPGKRNKAKALRDALRGGQAAVSLFANRYAQVLPEVEGFVDGWYLSEKETDQDETIGQQERLQHYCCYDDALELMDLYIPLPLEAVQ